MDSRGLRSVLSCYGTGVAIITARTHDERMIGVTVNSFASVSLEPPMVSFSLARSANVLQSFQKTEAFAVNILAFSQAELSNMFARPSTARWEATSYTQSARGMPLFSGSLAQLECTKTAEHDGGDHVIFLGMVDLFHLHLPADPLLFFRGRYGTYVPNPWGKLPPPESALSDFSISGWG